MTIKFIYSKHDQALIGSVDKRAEITVSKMLFCVSSVNDTPEQVKMNKEFIQSIIDFETFKIKSDLMKKLIPVGIEFI